MSSTYSIYIGPNRSDKLEDVIAVLSHLPDNTGKVINPEHVRDAVFTLWENSVLKLTSVSGTSQSYIGIDDTHAPTPLRLKMFLGKRTQLGSDVMSNSLLLSDTDMFIYNNRQDIDTQDTKISLLAGSTFSIFDKAPYVLSKGMSNRIDLDIVNPATAGVISISSSTTDINGFRFDRQLMGATQNGWALKYNSNTNKVDLLPPGDVGQVLTVTSTYEYTWAAAGGPAGPKGATGPQGSQGPQGNQGPIGPQGLVGSIGVTGSQGSQGPQGSQGSNGANGGSGPIGPIGPQGPIGANGSSIVGPQGSQGPQGPQGLVGAAGTSGSSGIDGIDGTSGVEGPQGATGPSGDFLGSSGTSGTSGSDGAQGPIGTGYWTLSGTTSDIYYIDGTVSGLYASFSTSLSDQFIKTGGTNSQILLADGTTSDFASIVSGGQIVVYEWKYSTSLSAIDPGSGNFRANSPTGALVTEIYISDITDDVGMDISALFEKIKGDWMIHIQQTNDATKYIQFTTNVAYDDHTGWWTIPVTYVQSSNFPITNNAKCSFIFINQNNLNETFQIVYNNSSVPQIQPTDVLGAVTTKSAMSLNTTPISVWQNIAGSTVSSINGDGLFTGVSASISNSVRIGSATSSTAKLHIRGSGTTASTTPLRVENSSGTQRFQIFDDGSISFNNASNTGTPTPTDSVAGQLNINGTLFPSRVINVITGNTTKVIRARRDVDDNDRWFVQTDSGGQVTYGNTLGGYFHSFSNNGTVTLNVGDGSNGNRVGIGPVMTLLAKLHVRGNGSTSSTTAFRVENSAGTPRYVILDDGEIGHRPVLSVTISQVSGMSMSADFNPTSGVAFYSDIFLSPTINQTGGANGITRGLYVNPILTSAPNYRAVETGNTTGYAFFAGGSASSAFTGNVAIGSTAVGNSRLFVAGVDTSGTQSALIVQNGASTQLMRIQNDGKVVIGTTTTNLTNSQGVLQIWQGTTNPYGIQFHTTSTSNFSLIGTDDGNSVTITSSNGNWKFSANKLMSSTAITSGLSISRVSLGLTKTYVGIQVAGTNNDAFPAGPENGLHAFADTSTINLTGTVTVATSSVLGSTIYATPVITLPGVPNPYVTFNLKPTINQTGTSSGSSHTILSNPTLTSVYNYRAFEFTSSATFSVNNSITDYIFSKITPQITASTNSQITGLEIGLTGSNLSFTVTRNTIRAIGGRALFGGVDNGSNFVARFENSSKQNIMQVRNDGVIRFGNNSNSAFMYPSAGIGGTQDMNGTGLGFSRASSGGSGQSFQFNDNVLSSTADMSTLAINGAYTVTTSFGYVGFSINNTINQTGTASGITRGIYVNPTLTSAPNWRSIETNNNIGYAIYASGTASSYFGGSIGLNNNGTLYGKLQVNTTLNTYSLVHSSDSGASNARMYGFRGITGLTGRFTLDALNDAGVLQRALMTWEHTTGNVSVGSTTMTSMFNVGTASQFQVTSAGNIITSGTLRLSSLGTAGFLVNDSSGNVTSSATTYLQNVTVESDWNTSISVAKLIQGVSNGPNGINGYHGMSFPHSVAGYASEIAMRNQAMWFRSSEASVWGTWLQMADRTWSTSTFMSNPMTSVGDMIFGTASGVPSKIGIGSTNQVLTVVGGVPAWASPSSAIPAFATYILSANFTITTTSALVLPFDTSVINIGSGVTTGTSSGEFALTTGYWEVTCNAQKEVNTFNAIISLYVGSTEVYVSAMANNSGSDLATGVFSTIFNNTSSSNVITIKVRDGATGKNVLKNALFGSSGTATWVTFKKVG